MAGVILDFATVDDAVIAADRGLSVASLANAVVGMRIGPLVEYAYQQRLHRLPALPASSWMDSLQRAMSDSGYTQSTSLRAQAIEFSHLPATQKMLPIDPAWTAYTMRLNQAAQAVGFDKSVGAGFAGAFTELVENVFVHSRRAKSGVVGYRFEGAEFEFVVADAGDGVLRSLRRSPEYKAVTDAGTALKMALNGHSRLGEGHGHGFRPLFVTLASLHGEVRFRSGDYALEMSGHGVTVNQADIRQRGVYNGLLVSIVCRSNPVHRSK